MTPALVFLLVCLVCLNWVIDMTLEIVSQMFHGTNLPVFQSAGTLHFTTGTSYPVEHNVPLDCAVFPHKKYPNCATY